MKIRHIFFSYVCNCKTIKELFASTLNGITVRVKCVSSTIAVLNARLVAAQANKKMTMGAGEIRSDGFCVVAQF